MKAEFDTLKKVYSLYNRILSVRKNADACNVFIQLGRRKRILAVSAKNSCKPEHESVFFQILIDWFMSNGEICYNRSEYDKDGNLIINLKTVD